MIEHETCLACGALGLRATTDHVVPRSLLTHYGYEGPPGMDGLNVQRLCEACNASKGTACVDYRDWHTHRRLVRRLLREGLYLRVAYARCGAGSHGAQGAHCSDTASRLR